MKIAAFSKNTRLIAAAENALMQGFDGSIHLSIPSPAPIDEHVLNLPERVLDLLPIGVCVCDRTGLIVRCNRRAAELWGRLPDDPENAGGFDERFFGACKLYGLDGKPIAHADSPAAKALATGVPVRNEQIAIERPDGSKLLIVLNIDALRDVRGTIIGAVNCFHDVADSGSLQNEQCEAGRKCSRLQENAPFSAVPMAGDKAAGSADQWLAAIVESSDDAIISKDLNGIITSLNKGAERIFGYTEKETLGKPVTMLIPVDRKDEEPAILARIRRGERVDHYETVRQKKDGTLIDISLTVSPVKDAEGRIVGASKIARDITGRRRAEERQSLLLREMSHRVKNLFSVASSIVALSARGAATPEALANAVQERLAALGRAHELTLAKPYPGAPLQMKAASLHSLIRNIVLPFENENGAARRVRVTGSDLTVPAASVTSFALLLHEFATNAAKYGALSTDCGTVEIACSEDNGRFILLWQERGGPPITRESESEGFGGVLVRATVAHQLRGEISREWKPEGLAIRLSFDKASVAG